MVTIAELKLRKESEHRTEFKEAKTSFNFDGGEHREQNKRRKCLLGYIVALANEGGGTLVLGMSDKFPHQVVGSTFLAGKIKSAENDVYQRLNIRVTISELYENELRVVVVEIPSRPVGRYLEFEGVGLMRVGESLHNLSQPQIHQILSEQEPDFSAKICSGLRQADLDMNAVAKLMVHYGTKHRSSELPLSTLQQVLSDLNLMNKQGELTYAALLLVGKTDVIHHHLPQAKIIWEFRQTEGQTHYDERMVVSGPLFIAIDEIWDIVNRKNSVIPVREKAFIQAVHVFNQEVIREAILNAVAHRDYTYQSEVVIKQFPRSIEIHNPGGFPKGVSLENLLTVNSTPRSRLMTDILEKTGLVERSGQGVDKIYSLTLQEGKPEPDYSASNIYQVSLIIKGNMEDLAFSNFIRETQKDLPYINRLSAIEIISLNWIKKGLYTKVTSNIISLLESRKLITRTTNSHRYFIADEQFQVSAQEYKIGTRYLRKEVDQILTALWDRALSIGELERLLAESLNRNQVKYLLKKLIEDDIVGAKGSGKGTRYYIVVPEGEKELPSVQQIIDLLKVKSREEAFTLLDATINAMKP
ncbi:MAG: AAA family ATPase [Flavobacterium psychrophilum]|nr:MAG: AAA family ATPase [Flavobacterium psychrophilum]